MRTLLKYAKNAPDRQPRQHPTTQFLHAGCPSCCPTNSVKALKALALSSTSQNREKKQSVSPAVLAQLVI